MIYSARLPNYHYKRKKRIGEKSLPAGDFKLLQARARLRTGKSSGKHNSINIKSGNMRGTVFILGLNTVMHRRSVYGF